MHKEVRGTMAGLIEGMLTTLDESRVIETKKENVVKHHRRIR